MDVNLLTVDQKVMRTITERKEGFAFKIWGTAYRFGHLKLSPWNKWNGWRQSQRTVKNRERFIRPLVAHCLDEIRCREKFTNKQSGRVGETSQPVVPTTSKNQKQRGASDNINSFHICTFESATNSRDAGMKWMQVCKLVFLHSGVFLNISFAVWVQNVADIFGEYANFSKERN